MTGSSSPLNVRLPAEMSERIDSFALQLASQWPGLRANRSVAIRALLERALSTGAGSGTTTDLSAPTVAPGPVSNVIHMAVWKFLNHPMARDVLEWFESWPELRTAVGGEQLLRALEAVDASADEIHARTEVVRSAAALLGSYTGAEGDRMTPAELVEIVAGYAELLPEGA